MQSITYQGGFHGVERSGNYSFQWTKQSFSFSLNPPVQKSILRITIDNNEPSDLNKLFISHRDGRFDEFVLQNGRCDYNLFNLPEGPVTLDCRLAHTLPPLFKDHDPRELGVKFIDAKWIPAEKAWEASSPEIIHIESSSRCNMNCTICGHSYGAYSNPKELPAEWNKHLVKIFHHSKTITLHGHGEPLLSPTLPKLLKMSRSAQPRVYLLTNGSLMLPHHLNLCLDESVQVISFSLDAATPQTYKKIRNNDWFFVWDNIERFLNERNRHLHKPRTCINMTIMKENATEIKKFVELAANKKIDEVWLCFFNNKKAAAIQDWSVSRENYRFQAKQNLMSADYSSILPELEDCLDIARRKGVKLHIDQLRTPYIYHENFGNKIHRMNTLPHARNCKLAWKELVLSAAGQIRSCPIQVDDRQLSMFSGERDLLDEWNSPQAQKLRQDLALGIIPDLCRGDCKYVHP